MFNLMPRPFLYCPVRTLYFRGLLPMCYSCREFNNLRHDEDVINVCAAPTSGVRRQRPSSGWRRRR